MTLNCNQARHIPIVEYLAECGINPAFIKGNNHWYLSPLREEKHASFKVDSKKNLWYDFGIGEGGNLIDLGIRLHHCSVEQLLARLGSVSVKPSFHQPIAPMEHDIKSPDTEESHIMVLDALPLHSDDLLGYIAGRGIDLDTARLYCREAEFRIKDNTYTAVGFTNRSGGFELRNSWFKGSSSPKDITIVESYTNTGTIKVVEGFIDFLSLLTLKQLHKTDTGVIILNSTALVGRAIDILHAYRDVQLYLNHDQAAYTAAAKIREAGINVTDASGFYRGYNDINEYLQAQLKQEQKQQQDHRPSQGLRR